MPLQSTDELIKQLKDQMSFLSASAQTFDNGNFAEAKRLSLAIRILLHDTKNSKSLLDQLGVKNNLQFYDTANEVDPTNLLPQNTLVSIRFEHPGHIKYVAQLDNLPSSRLNTKKTFTEWWNRTIIVDKKKASMTRKEIVLNMSNTDGGAHVDPVLKERYSNLARNNSMGWKFKTGNDLEYTNLSDIELVTVRQISHEVIKTIKEQLKRIL